MTRARDCWIALVEHRPSAEGRHPKDRGETSDRHRWGRTSRRGVSVIKRRTG